MPDSVRAGKGALLAIAAMLLSCCALKAASTTARDHAESDAIERFRDSSAAHSLAAAPLAKEVFSAALRHDYRFSTHVRTAAIEYVQDVRPAGIEALLRQVAELRPDPRDDWQRTSDLMLISDTLFTLMLWRDPEAVRLNRARLLDEEPVGPMAIYHLDRLQDWPSTRRIQRLLRTTPAKPSSCLELASILTFLAHSPETSSDVCPDVRRAEKAFGSTVLVQDFFCERSADNAKILRERFGCDASQ